MKGADVRVLELRDGLRFALQSPPVALIPRQRLGQDLDGDGSAQPGVPGFVHLPHAALTAQLNDLVRPQAGTCFERHEGVGDSIEVVRTTDRRFRGTTAELPC